MSGKLALGLVFVVLVGLAVTAAVLSFGERDPASPAPSPAPSREDPGPMVAVPPPFDDARVVSGVVAGRVVDERARPVPEAEVRLLLPEEVVSDRRGQIQFRMGGGQVSSEMSLPVSGGLREVAVARTGEDGAFSFTTAEAGPFRLDAAKPGYAAASLPLVERGTKDAVLTLPDAGGVRGVVVEVGGAPLPGAIVTGGRGMAVADESGAFLLADVKAGETEISAIAAGYEGGQATVRVVAGETADLDGPISLTPKPGLVGRVFDPRGEPLEGVSIFAGVGFMGGDGGMTDAGGRYHLGNLETGSITIRFRHLEYLPAEIDGIRHEKGARTIAPDVRLEPGGVIAGRILDPEGRPVAGASARAAKDMKAGDVDMSELILAGMSGQNRPSSGRDGAFRVAGLAAGTYTLAVSAKGYRPFRREEIEVRVPETVTVEVRLEAGASIAGRVLSRDGEPVEGATVTASVQFVPADFRDAMLMEREAPTATTDESGAFEIRGLGEGKVTLSVVASGFARLMGEEAETGARDLVLTLTRTGSVSGRVVSRETGEPVASANVSVMPAAAAADSPMMRMAVPGSGGATTGEDGAFVIRDVAPGDYRLCVDHAEHAPAVEEGIVVSSSTEVSGIEIALERGEEIRGYVVRASDGAPVPGARVALSGPVMRNVKADEQGRVRLPGLLAGTYAASVTAEGFASSSIEGILVPAPGEVRFELSRGGSIRGVVNDEDGQPIAGQAVILGSGTDFGEGFSQTGSDGTFSFPNVRPGRYTLMVMKVDGSGGFGFNSATRSVTVEEGREAWVEFGGEASPKRATLKGRLLSRGKPLASRMIMLMKVDAKADGLAGLMTNMKMTTTDSEGRFNVPDLEPGRYRVLTGNFGGSSMQSGMEVDVSEAGEIEQDIVLPEGELSGVVVGEDGKPAAGVKVTLVDPVKAAVPVTGLAEMLALFQAQTATDEEGAFEFSSVAEGTYLLQAGRDGLATTLVPDVTISKTAGPPLRVTIGKGVALTVTAVDDRDAPVTDATLILLDAAGRRVFFGDNLSRSLGGTGRAEVPIRPGTWRLVVQSDSFATEDRTVRVSRDEEIRFTLRPGGSIALFAAAGGVPVAGASVRFFREDGTEVAHHVIESEMMGGAAPRETGEDGTLIRDRLPSGSLRVLVTTPEGGRGEAVVRIREGERVDVAVDVE